MRPPEQQIPQQVISNIEFCEWLIMKVIQDPSHLYSFLMLDILQDLNFGAKTNKGSMDKVTKESVLKEYLLLGQKRHFFDNLRTTNQPQAPQQFVIEARRRLKK